MDARQALATAMKRTEEEVARQGVYVGLDASLSDYAAAILAALAEQGYTVTRSDAPDLRAAVERVNDLFDVVMEAIQEQTITREFGDRLLGNIAAVRSGIGFDSPPEYCDDCPHAMHLHADDGSCGGGCH